MSELTDKEKAKAFDEICDLFKIGGKVRSTMVLKKNIQNCIDHADKLHAIEARYFMAPCDIEDEEEGCIADDVCLLNCWGETLDEHVKNFGKVCNKVYYDGKDKEIERLTAIATKHATRVDELYQALLSEFDLLLISGWDDSYASEIRKITETFDKSRIEAEEGDGICN